MVTPWRRGRSGPSNVPSKQEHRHRVLWLAHHRKTAAATILREVGIDDISIGDVRTAIIGKVPSIGARHELLEPAEELRDAAGPIGAVLVADKRGPKGHAIGMASAGRRN